MALIVGCRGLKILSSKITTPQFVSGNVRGVKRWLRPTLTMINKRNEEFRKKTDQKTLLQLERRSNFLEWNRDAELYSFGKRLNEDFRLDLLDQAFIHRSYFFVERAKLEALNVDPGDVKIIHNEDLSLLGEKIISDHVWNYFSHFFPRFPVEGIQKIHDHLTSTELLANIAKNIGTTHIILADYPIEDETYAQTLKAIVGALVQSQGIQRGNIFVRDLVIAQFAGEDVNDYLPIEDYYSVLKDILNRDGFEPPEPRIICQTAVNTVLANYHIGIYSNKKLLGHCFGESVDIAIQLAALDCLKRLFHTTESAAPLRFDAELDYEGKIQRNLPLNDWSATKFAESHVEMKTAV